MGKRVTGKGAAFLSAVLLLIWAGACSRPSERSLREGSEEGRYRGVVAFGDSIGEGYGLDEGWPEMVERDLRREYPEVRIRNAGRSGDTAGEGLARLERDVLEHEPDLVLVAFGLNDMRYRHPLERFRSDLEAILSRLESEGIESALLTTTRLARGARLVAAGPEPYNEVIRELAASRGLYLIEVYGESKGLNTHEYMMDVAHPNGEGAAALAVIISRALTR